MTTVTELIEYLQTLPAETKVNVAVNIECGYASYVGFEELELPNKNDDGSYWDSSNNLDYTGQPYNELDMGRK